jgi:hypothetical protein
MLADRWTQTMQQPKMKSTIDILKAAEGIQFEDPDGDVSELKLLPPLTDAELIQLGTHLLCLSRCAGHCFPN